jgi:hypothetical protein
VTTALVGAIGNLTAEALTRRIENRNPRRERSTTGGIKSAQRWLTVIGHAKDSLWSVDFFRCESILLKSYWVMVVMDVFTRRIMNSHRTEGELTLWGIRSLGLASILVMLASSAHRSWRKTFCGHSALVTMEYTTLGKTGLRVSVAGLCRKRSTQRTSRCIRVARGGGCAEGPSLNESYRRTARHLPSCARSGCGLVAEDSSLCRLSLLKT